jgi:hypothetical protein
MHGILQEGILGVIGKGRTGWAEAGYHIWAIMYSYILI